LKREARLKKTLRIAEKALYARRKGSKMPPLEMAIHAILAPGNPAPRVGKAMAGLRKSFVDWNELRVSSWKEIGEVLEKQGIADAGDKAITLKNLLRAVFDRFNKISLDPLMAMRPEETKKILEGMEDVPEHVIGAILHLNLGMTAPYYTPGIVRVAKRIGLVGDYAFARAKKDLEKIVSRKNAFRFQQHLAYLAHTVCLEKITFCARCPLNKVCETGMETLKREEAAAKPRPARKKAARSRTGASSARKKAAKKPAKKAAKKPAKKAAKKAAKKKSASKTRSTKKAARKK